MEPKVLGTGVGVDGGLPVLCAVHLAVQLQWSDGETIDLRSPAAATGWTDDKLCEYLEAQLKLHIEMVRLKLKQRKPPEPAPELPKV